MICVNCGAKPNTDDKCSRFMGNVEHIFEEHDFQIVEALS